MSFVPILSLAACALGLLLVLLGGRDRLHQRIAARVGAMAGEDLDNGSKGRAFLKRTDIFDYILFGRIKQELRLVAGTIRPGHVIAFCIVLSIAGGAALWFGGWRWLVASTVIGLGLGRRSIKLIAEHHHRQFLDNFPAYLDRIRKLVEAGNSLSHAMKKGLAYANPRVASYISPALRRHELGMHLATTLDTQAKYLGIPEISQLALVAYVISRYGGSLKDSMAHMAQVERDRLRVNRELLALTAEVRTSAKIFVLLPLFVAGALFAIHPSYISFFGSDPTGQVILASSAASLFIGLAIMRRMSRLE